MAPPLRLGFIAGQQLLQDFTGGGEGAAAGGEDAHDTLGFENFFVPGEQAAAAAETVDLGGQLRLRVSWAGSARPAAAFPT